MLNLYPPYPSDPDRLAKYKNFCRVKMMLHHPFRCTDLNDSFNLDNGTSAVSWASPYDHCRARHAHLRHLVDPLGAPSDELIEESDNERMNNVNGDDVKHEELLGMRRPNHDGSQAEVKTDLGDYSVDKSYA